MADLLFKEAPSSNGYALDQSETFAASCTLDKGPSYFGHLVAR